MPNRRILSLWFPRLAAEHQLRREGRSLPGPLVMVADRGGAQILVSLNHEAEAEGLRQGQPLRDAQALCPGLVVRTADPQREAAFLAVLRRWAGKFSPWVGEQPPAALILDLTGCAHLFGGEEALLHQARDDCSDVGLSVRMGIADTVGAAWALARYAGRQADPLRSGDAIDQEAPATRSRAVRRRHWERGGSAPQVAMAADAARLPGCIALPGHTRQALAPLPLTALRLPENTVVALGRIGLRRIEDMMGMPRAALARRFGRDAVRRLDQALGAEPEPVSPANAPLRFAVRLTLPDPIGLRDDLEAAIDRLLPPLTQNLREKGRGARRLRLQCFRCDQSWQTEDLGLARASNDPDRMRPLLVMKLGEIDAGPGIDTVRLEALVTEPVHDRQHKGHLDAGRAARERLTANTAMDDLIGRLGARLGLEAITRRHPGDSNIPEKTALTLAAAWSEPAPSWPRSPTPRPLLMFPPEPVTAPDIPALPEEFRWRRRGFVLASARGPERIAPEWWLDDPNWRSGTRDYWQIEAETGERLWLYFAHGGSMSKGWFCQGIFA